MKKNGYNMDTANIFCADEPNRMLANMLAVELSAAGFRVLRDSRGAGPSTVVISGVLQQAFIEPRSDFFVVFTETDLALRLKATAGNGLWAERTFYIKSEDPFLFDAEGSSQLSFDSGVGVLLATTVGAIANLMERLPAAPPTPHLSSP